MLRKLLLLLLIIIAILIPIKESESFFVWLPEDIRDEIVQKAYFLEKNHNITLTKHKNLLNHISKVSFQIPLDPKTHKYKLTYEQFYQKVRINILKDLIDAGFDRFKNKPLAKGNYSITLSGDDFTMNDNIKDLDGLDNILQNKLEKYKNIFTSGAKANDIFTSYFSLTLDSALISGLNNIYLFKSEQDLRELGYRLVSYRTRNNFDKSYRRYNIKTAFHNIGNVFLLNSYESFSFLDNIHYSPRINDGKIAFTMGLANIGTEKEVYGGGICGAASALYQGIVTNTALSVTEISNHSVRSKKLYSSYINGEKLAIPGIDATVFSNGKDAIDLKFKNTEKYPILVVLNYDGKVGGEEEIFTLGKEDTTGSFSYVGNFIRNGQKCYIWNINGNKERYCYRKVFN